MTGRARPGDPLALCCEAAIPGVCTRRAEHRHHRLRRSQGGDDSAMNTADLCSPCHEHIHASVAWAIEHGWLRPSWSPPALVPAHPPTDRTHDDHGPDPF